MVSVLFSPLLFTKRLSQSSLLFFFSLLVSPCLIPFFLPSPPHFLPSLQHCFTEDLRPPLPSAHLQTAGLSDRPEVCSLGRVAQSQPWVLWAFLWAECRGRVASPRYPAAPPSSPTLRGQRWKQDTPPPTPHTTPSLQAQEGAQGPRSEPWSRRLKTAIPEHVAPAASPGMARIQQMLVE